jgi:hypothetical protein
MTTAFLRVMRIMFVVLELDNDTFVKICSIANRFKISSCEIFLLKEYDIIKDGE